MMPLGVLASAYVPAAAAAGGLWVAAGASGMLATSPDGINWTQGTSSFGTTILTIAHNGVQWVAAGDSGLLATSPDGINWTQGTSSFGTKYIYALGHD